MKTTSRNQSGFTLVELLIVVAIIGIIAAIAIPNLLSAIQRGKQKRSMGDLKTLASSIEQFNTDISLYPGVAFGDACTAPVGACNDRLYLPALNFATYLVTPIAKDGWYSSTTPANHIIQYGSDSVLNGQQYIACSFGADNAVDAIAGAVPAGCVAIATTDVPLGRDGITFECDITIADGQFIQQPNGKQTKSATADCVP